MGEGASAVGTGGIALRASAKRDTARCRRRNALMKSSQTKLVRLIALFKLLKGLLLIALGVAALKLLHTDITSMVEDWATLLGFLQNSRFLGRALGAAAALTPDRVREVILGSFLYGGLFLTEGVGLWLLKRWAMWFTVIITGSFLPLEMYELARHPSAGKAAILVVNLVFAVYLARRIRDERRS
jgi:uncharacterized membrane protein (DUF2068 family)